MAKGKEAYEDMRMMIKGENVHEVDDKGEGSTKR